MPDSKFNGLKLVESSVTPPAATFTRTQFSGADYGIDCGGDGELKLEYFANPPGSGGSGPSPSGGMRG